MFSAFINSFKIVELRKRIMVTAGIVILCRLAANIPCPGVNPVALDKYFQLINKGVGGQLTEMFSIFSGGALQKFAIATLGIMPYISASIIMQLLVPVLPSLERISREGEAGRQKINQYTRYLTLVICLVQGTVAAMAMMNPGQLGLPVPKESLVSNPGVGFVLMTLVILTCGTMILMWLGEQITEFGIGNGISIIIMVNIIARMPSALSSLYEMILGPDSDHKPVYLLILLLLFAFVTAAAILLNNGQRRIPIQMARRVAGSSKAQTSTTYMPLKVNFSGVMPIIFGGAILMVLSILLNSAFVQNIPVLNKLGGLFQYGSVYYMTFYGILILLFSFFWVANMFKPLEISDNLKAQGAFIPGVRPGQPTADYLDNTMTRITFAGAIFLTALAVSPMVLSKNLGVPMLVATFFGGTSLLIMVGVVLDTLSQMESHLTMRNYSGFLTKGKVESRRRSF
jgi:preprotein translocase subunit SecY